MKLVRSFPRSFSAFVGDCAEMIGWEGYESEIGGSLSEFGEPLYVTSPNGPGTFGNWTGGRVDAARVGQTSFVPWMAPHSGVQGAR